MAITGELHWHGITISNAYVNIDNIRIVKKQFITNDVEVEGGTRLVKQLLVQYQYNIFTSKEDYNNSMENAIQTVLNKRTIIYLADDVGTVDILNACYIDLKNTVNEFSQFVNC